MIWILHDTKNGYPFLERKLPVESQKLLSPFEKRKYLSWILGAISALYISKRHDTIICVYDFQAILCYLLGKLSFRRRKILAINILLKQKKTIKNRITRFLYRKALTDNNFVATVSSTSYASWLNKILGTKIAFPLLKDVYLAEYEINARKLKGAPNKGYVFCGGRNGRDWHFLLEVARATPELKFKLVFPSNIKISEIPENTTCYQDVPVDDFNKLLAESAIIALPLDSEAPSGLIVLFQAAALGKPIIITKTATTEKLFDENTCICLENKAIDWSNSLRILSQDSSKRDLLGKNMHDSLQKYCNEEAYCKQLADIIVTHF